MATRVIECKIKGQSPLLMNRFPMEPVEKMEKKSKEEQAEYCAYRQPETDELYVPGFNIWRCLVQAASYSKGKGRATLKKTVAACMIVQPEYCLLGQDTYNIDSRPVVISATKGRIVRHRPRFEDWELAFSIEFDDTLLKESEVRRIVDDAGKLVGLLDYRPEKLGPFGRFVVLHWSGNGAPEEPKRRKRAVKE